MPLRPCSSGKGLGKVCGRFQVQAPMGIQEDLGLCFNSKFRMVTLIMESSLWKENSWLHNIFCLSILIKEVQFFSFFFYIYLFVGGGGWGVWMVFSIVMMTLLGILIVGVLKNYQVSRIWCDNFCEYSRRCSNYEDMLEAFFMAPLCFISLKVGLICTNFMKKRKKLSDGSPNWI